MTPFAWSTRPPAIPEGRLLHDVVAFARDYDAAPLERAFAAAIDLLRSWLRADYLCIHFDDPAALDEAIPTECLRRCPGFLTATNEHLAPPGPFRHALAIPLRHAGERYAVVNAFSTEERRNTPPRTFEAIAFLGHHLGAGITRHNATRDGEEYRRFIALLSELVASRDPASAAHQHRTMHLAERLAIAADVDALTLRVVRRGAILHDIGKIAIPEHILWKPARLNDEEFDLVRTHAKVGEELVGRLPGALMRTVAEAVGAHHERIDGSGYPRGLSGSEIPMAARIIGICDAYDAMTSGRPYALARSRQEALGELIAHAGTQFDPELVEAFVRARCWRAGEENAPFSIL